jgi:hypothetical protein
VMRGAGRPGSQEVRFCQLDSCAPC